MLRALSLCTCCRQYPGAATGRRLRSSHPAVSAFPEVAVGSACTSTFSELARRSLALRPAHSRRHLYVTSYTEGFSHFVTSMTAPVDSGWSVRRVGLAPTGKRRLLTAHANTGHSPTAWRMGQRTQDGQSSASGWAWQLLSYGFDQALSKVGGPIGLTRDGVAVWRTLAGATAPGVQRPRAGAADCQRKEAAGHGDVLLQLYDLIGGGVEE